MSRVNLVIEQIVFARNYTRRLLDNTKREDWFREPAEGVTHIAWQIGHLAMAQYRMALDRIRGSRSTDAELISEGFLKVFGKESVPDPRLSNELGAAEIVDVFDRVHEQLLQELPVLTDSELDEPVLKPHSLIKTKLWALLWCAQHEGVHAGQIALLRRLLGYPPIW